MGAHKKGGGTAKASEDQDELSRVPLQAILLADSFAQKFRPITLERPKVLLPLVNVPMIDYTLAWLESAGVEEVFVFCCAHSKQVISYLESSKWLSQPTFSVMTIESHNSISAGDALRLIYEHNVINGDFVLISGDTVSNMSLTQALQEHKDRKKKDNNAVMTMVIKRSKPSSITHQSRIGTDELFMAIDPETKQLLFYEDKNSLKGTISIDKMLISNNPSISLHTDMQDCYIDICSQEVLSLFTDNFDYQHLRQHFVKGLLVDDIMGYKIFTHEIHSSYAARIDNFRSYDTVSKDIIQRWTYPVVPDVKFFGNCAVKLDRQGMYRASEVGLSRSAQIGPFTVIGNGTTIGNNTKMSNSVVGEGCTIGSNVVIEGSYIWNNVTIEDGCKLRHAIVCDGVVLKTGADLEPGVVLSFNVVIGPQFVVPAYSKVSLLQQPVNQDSDEELEYADNSGGVVEMSPIPSTTDEINGKLSSNLPMTQCWDASEVGSGGAGYIWSICEGGYEEEWKHSVAPIPIEKLCELSQSAEDDLDFSKQNIIPTSGELKPEAVSNDSEDNDDFQDDDSAFFEKEVQATFLRAVHENVKEDNIILEVNSLRLSYNKESADCAGALFFSVMKLALENASTHTSSNNYLAELYKAVESLFTSWKRLLKYYLPSIDEETKVTEDQLSKLESISCECDNYKTSLQLRGIMPLEIEVIMKFEEICSESGKDFSALFAKILHLLYEVDILQEEAILAWADEKQEADESDKIFVNQSEKFIQWLREASEEEDEEDE